MKDNVLTLKDVSIGVKGQDKRLTHHVNIALERGKVTALVGESGSGKTITAMSIAGLLNPALYVQSGQCLLGETDLYKLSESELRQFRGKKISVVFQEPMTALNPLHSVEKQIGEMLETHGTYSKKERDQRILDLLNLVKIPDAKRRMTSYPHELSGGQRQRIMIAMALANNPDILLLDEPTTALDVTVQAEILLLLRDIREKIGTSMLLISHDLHMVSKTSDYIYVMQNGEVVEEGETKQVFDFPSHEYTRYLIDAIPKNAPDAAPENMLELVRGELINVKYPIKTGLLRRTTGYVHAVKDISFGLRAGETLGIVGESGSGKSTLASALLHLTQYDGLIKIQGITPKTLNAKELRHFRKSLQPIFQDPYAALSPRMNIQQILEEGLNLHYPNMTASKKYNLICETLADTGMDPDICLTRYPHEFSGGQRQRIAIARSVVVRPSILILDEPTSALDRTVQKQVLELLERLQKKHAMAFIFISHDLSVIRAVSHQIIVMKNGEVVESGTGQDIFENPKTDYTKSLLQSALLSDF